MAVTVDNVDTLSGPFQWNWCNSESFYHFHGEKILPLFAMRKTICVVIGLFSFWLKICATWPGATSGFRSRKWKISFISRPLRSIDSSSDDGRLSITAWLACASISPNVLSRLNKCYFYKLIPPQALALWHHLGSRTCDWSPIVCYRKTNHISKWDRMSSINCYILFNGIT